jgi:hypothetical protein
MSSDNGRFGNCGMLIMFYPLGYPVHCCSVFVSCSSVGATGKENNMADELSCSLVNTTQIQKKSPTPYINCEGRLIYF